MDIQTVISEYDLSTTLEALAKLAEANGWGLDAELIRSIIAQVQN